MCVCVCVCVCVHAILILYTRIEDVLFNEQLVDIILNSGCCQIIVQQCICVCRARGEQFRVK